MADAHRTTPDKYTPVPCPSCGTPHSVISGQWLRYVRERAGLTLREMSRRLEVSAAYLCDIEHNRRNGSPDIRAAYEAL